MLLNIVFPHRMIYLRWFWIHSIWRVGGTEFVGLPSIFYFQWLDNTRTSINEYSNLLLFTVHQSLRPRSYPLSKRSRQFILAEAIEFLMADLYLQNSLAVVSIFITRASSSLSIPRLALLDQIRNFSVIWYQSRSSKITITSVLCHHCFGWPSTRFLSTSVV